MFTGREYDSETDLYSYRARMYSPALGRFLQPDPIGYADSMNLYQYCGNNPVNRIDLWGYSWGHVHDMFFQWWYECGPANWVFVEGSEEVEELENSPGVNKAREDFLRHNQEREQKGKPPESTTYDYEFGRRGFIDAGDNPTRQFCGGYGVTITPNGDGTKTITVSNDTNMWSFLIHLPGVKNYPRNPTGNQIGGSMKQQYTWTEDYNYSGQNETYFEVRQKRVEKKIDNIMNGGDIPTSRKQLIPSY